MNAQTIREVPNGTYMAQFAGENTPREMLIWTNVLGEKSLICPNWARPIFIPAEDDEAIGLGIAHTLDQIESLTQFIIEEGPAPEPEPISREGRIVRWLLFKGVEVPDNLTFREINSVLNDLENTVAVARDVFPYREPSEIINSESGGG